MDKIKEKFIKDLFVEIDAIMAEDDARQYILSREEMHRIVERFIHSHDKEVLEHYSDWLHRKGYIDADYYTEQPLAVHAYIKELKQKDTKPKSE
jgi:uncharacterized protein YutD